MCNPRAIEIRGRRLVVDDGLSQKPGTIAGAGISVNSLWSVYGEITDGKASRVLPDYEVSDQWCRSLPIERD